MRLEELILIILNENSGGIKMIQLITEIIARTCEYPKTDVLQLFNEDLQFDEADATHWTRRFLDALNRKLEEMRASGKIGLLKYAWTMGETAEIAREKIFVYLSGGYKNE